MSRVYIERVNETVETSLLASADSALLNIARNLGLDLPDDLQRLAVARGCRYYVVEDGPLPATNLPLTNAELAVALLSPGLPPQPQDIRVAAAVLSSPDVNPALLASLATKEGCDGLVRYIAECGLKYEPENPFWSKLLDQVRAAVIPSGALPHPTRFIEMTGMVRGRTGFFTRWIRPMPAAV